MPFGSVSFLLLQARAVWQCEFFEITDTCRLAKSEFEITDTCRLAKSEFEITDTCRLAKSNSSLGLFNKK